MGKKTRRDAARAEPPVDARSREALHELGRELDRRLNCGRGRDDETGYVMLVFPFGRAAAPQLLMNGAKRRDLIALLRATIADLEDEETSVGRA